MAAKTWETDFRYPAIQASIRELKSADCDDPFDWPGSLCIPVAERPVMGWTPGKIWLIALILGFVCLGLGAWLASREETGPLIIGVCCSLSGFGFFFMPMYADRPIIRGVIGERAHELIARNPDATVLSSELSNADRSQMKLSIDGDDHVLILFDTQEKRLLIDGIGARYQIRADDVELLEPFVFTNYVGAEIVCRINAHTKLHFALARPSGLYELTRQLPFLFFVRKWIKNRLLEECRETLVN